MEVVEPPSSQHFPVETQHVGHEAGGDLQTVENREEQGHRDAKKVEACTQTRKCKGKHKSNQTPVVVQRHQETQTDFTVAKQDDASDESSQAAAESAAESQLTADALRGDNSAQTPPRKNEEDSGAPSHQEQKPRIEPSPAAGRSADPTDSQTKTEAKPKSYATAVSGDGGGDGQSKAANKTPSQTRR